MPTKKKYLSPTTSPVDMVKAAWEENQKFLASPTHSDYRLRKKAALKADRLFLSMGEDEQMEDSDQYRENMLGSKYHFPMFSTSQASMKHLNQARDLADKVREENRAKAQKKVKGNP